MRWCEIGGLIVVLALGMGTGCKSETHPPPEDTHQRIAAERIAVSDESLDGTVSPQLSPELIIGADPSRPGAALGRVTAIDADSEGRIYVLDGAAVVVRMFSRDGTLVRTIGRAGDGPGEFRRPMDVAISSDTVYVLSNTMQAFDTSGTYLDASLPGVSGNLAFANSIDVAGSTIIFHRMTMGLESREYRDDTVRVFSLQFPDKVKQIHQFPIRHYFYGRGIEYPTVLSPGPVMTAGRNGELYHSVGDSFHVNVYGTDGGLRRTISGTPIRVPVTDRDLEDFGRTTKRRVMEVMRSDVDIPDYRKTGPVPEFRPVIGALFVSTDGTLLIERLDVTPRPYDLYDTNGGMTWLLLGPGGERIAQFALPVDLVVSAFRGCRLYGHRQLEDGTPVVHRYAVPGCE